MHPGGASRAELRGGPARVGGKPHADAGDRAGPGAGGHGAPGGAEASRGVIIIIVIIVVQFTYHYITVL